MSLIRLPSGTIIGAPFFHKVDYLRHRVLLNRFVLNVGRCVVKSQQDGPETCITEHQRKPADLGGFCELADSRISGIHLDELLSNLELYFSQTGEEITDCVYQDILLTKIPGLNAIE